MLYDEILATVDLSLRKVTNRMNINASTFLYSIPSSYPLLEGNILAIVYSLKVV